MHTLLIEDNIALAQTVTRYLANEDITCTLRTHGTEGYMEAVNNNYDVIILDIELPGMDGIEICRRLRSEVRVTPIIMLTITDTGIGMTDTQQNRIFERFYRADRSGTIPGTGIGLTIVERIVRLYGWNIAVRSETGVGTSFIIMMR